MKKLLLAPCLALLISLGIRAQKPNATCQAYIDKFAATAIDQMNRHKIPASITLAQGLLESGAGKSNLAVNAHNHFGIKNGSNWNGPYVLQDDDQPKEKFRHYASDADSYEDHSYCLLKPRYARLFTYDMTDYKAWARGLKACGYATNPSYPEKLINIIETYKLYEYDRGKLPPEGSVVMIATAMGGGVAAPAATAPSAHTPASAADVMANASFQPGHSSDAFFAKHPVFENNGNYYIRVLKGDDLYSISEATGVMVRDLRKFNELPIAMDPQPGYILYMKEKRQYADKAFRDHPHTVQSGQSVYDIAQMYGMKLKTIYKLNHLSDDYEPRVGDVLKVY